MSLVPATEPPQAHRAEHRHMTTTMLPVARPAALPTALLAAASVLLLTNDVPSSEAVRSAAGTVASWPPWARDAVVLVSEGGLVLLAALLAVAAWQARSAGPRRVATALVGAMGVVLALGVSEIQKVLLAQDRPCRTVPGLQAVVECPPVGDWSLPSNHATLAAALAAAVVWTVPRRWPVAVGCALLVAAARVGLGVHYPHDVVDGLVLGALAGSASVLLLRRPVTSLVTAGARVPALRLLLSARAGGSEARAETRIRG
jgi:undecaprenyl-diphosphatase